LRCSLQCKIDSNKTNKSNCDLKKKKSTPLDGQKIFLRRQIRGKACKQRLQLEQRSMLRNRVLENCRIWCRHRIIRMQGIVEDEDGSNLEQMLRKYWILHERG